MRNMNYQGFFLNDRLSDAQIEKFKLFEEEELIFACREHWLPLTIRLIKNMLVGIALTIMVGWAVMFFFQSILLAMSFSLFLALIVNLALVRELIHWSFHIYIATTKQIIEVHYSPLLSHEVNSVLLDQIRCTEIDVEMYGIIPELIGIGNVELTFDRPTHKEEFVIRGIRSPRRIASLLSAHIHQGVTFSPVQAVASKQMLWTKELKKNKYRFLGEVSYGGYNNSN